jgi:hypothetical protein
MSSSRGQKQTLRVGHRDVPVQLISMKQSVAEAKYETRRVERAEPAPVEATPSPVPVEAVAPAPADLLAPAPAPEPTSGGFEPLERETADVSASSAEPVVTIERGVTGPGGVWVDCTERLEAIDTATKLSAMQLEFTVARNHLPSERVTGAHYMAPAGEGAPAILTALWVALKTEQCAAVVRWTKRTNQALGAIVPRGTKGHEHLVLLELAWSAEVRSLEARANLSTLVGDTELGSPIVEAARDLVVAFREGPSVFESVVDERTEQRAALLEAAREGRKWSPPEQHEVTVSEVEAFDHAVADAA